MSRGYCKNDEPHEWEDLGNGLKLNDDSGSCGYTNKVKCSECGIEGWEEYRYTGVYDDKGMLEGA